MAAGATDGKPTARRLEVPFESPVAAPLGLEVRQLRSSADLLSEAIGDPIKKAVFGSWRGTLPAKASVSLEFTIGELIDLEAVSQEGRAVSVPGLHAEDRVPLLKFPLGGSSEIEVPIDESLSRGTSAPGILWVRRAPPMEPCGAEWRMHDQWTSAPLSPAPKLTGLAENDEAWFFHPEVGEIRLQAGVALQPLRARGRLARRVVKFIPRQGVTWPRTVLLFGEGAIPIGTLSVPAGELAFAAPEGTWRLQVVGDGRFRTVWSGEVKAVEGAPTLEIREVDFAWGEVAFVDAEENPVERVITWSPDAMVLSPQRTTPGPQRTDGRVAFSGLPRTGEVLLCFRAPWGERASLRRAMPGSERVDLGVVRFAGRNDAPKAAGIGRITGLVIDAGGHPVAGAEVRAFTAREANARSQALAGRSRGEQVVAGPLRGEQQVFRTKTDELGAFALERVSLGAVWSLVVSASGSVPELVDGLEFAHGETAVDAGVIALSAGREVHGRVVTRLGEPVTGATVTAAVPSGGGWSGVRTEKGTAPVLSDESGNFLIGRLPLHTPLLLFASKGGFAVGIAQVPEEGDDEVLIELTPGLILTGRVTAADGTPVAKALVRVRALAGTPEVEPTREKPLENFNPVSVTDRDGRYRFGGLPCRSYELEIQAADYLPTGASSSAGPCGGEPMVLDFTLERAFVWTGRVLDSAGVPIAGAIVRVHGGGGRATAPDGTFRIRLAEPGLVPVVVEIPGRPSFETLVDLRGSISGAQRDLRIP